MANTRRTAQTIQIGDAVKPVSRTEWLVVEAMADRGGEHGRLVFLLEDGTTLDVLPGAFIPWRSAPNA